MSTPPPPPRDAKHGTRLADRRLARIGEVSRWLAIGYALFGVLGLPTLWVLPGWRIALAIAFPLYVAVLEGILGAKYRASLPDEGTVWLRTMLVHQALVLVLGVIVLFLLGSLSMAPILDHFPVWLMEALKESTAQFGMTPESYMLLSWRICLAVVGLVFVGKQCWICWLYASGLRRGSQRSTS